MRKAVAGLVLAAALLGLSAGAGTAGASTTWLCKPGLANDPCMGSIKTGQGPSEMTVIDRPDLGIQRLYVALFNDNAVAVIDLDPASPFYNTVIGEIR